MAAAALSEPPVEHADIVHAQESSAEGPETIVSETGRAVTGGTEGTEDPSGDGAVLVDGLEKGPEDLMDELDHTIQDATTRANAVSISCAKAISSQLQDAIHYQAERRRSQDRRRPFFSTETQQHYRFANEELITKGQGIQWDKIGNPYDFDAVQKDETQRQSKVDKAAKGLLELFFAEGKIREEEYAGALASRTKQIETMICAMRENVTTLEREIASELQNIEQTSQKHISRIREEQDKALRDMIKQQEDMKINNYKRLTQMREASDMDIDILRRALSNSLETLRAQLSERLFLTDLKIQQARASYTVNSEKLEYNYQSLRKRDEENTVFISNQKRRINRLTDTLISLQGKLGTLEQELADLPSKREKDIKKAKEHYEGLKNKFALFERRNVEKFKGVWKMQLEIAVTYMNTLREAQVMVMDATHDHHGMRENFPGVEKLLEEALNEAQLTKNGSPREVLQVTSNDTIASRGFRSHTERNAELHAFLDHLLEAGTFLVDPGLLTIIESRFPYKSDRSLLLAYSMLSALGISAIEDAFEVIDDLEAAGYDAESDTSETFKSVLQDYLAKRKQYHPPPEKVPQDLKEIARQFRVFWTAMANSVLDEEEVQRWNQLLVANDAMKSRSKTCSQLQKVAISLSGENAKLTGLIHRLSNAKIMDDLLMPPELNPRFVLEEITNDGALQGPGTPFASHWSLELYKKHHNTPANPSGLGSRFGSETLRKGSQTAN